MNDVLSQDEIDALLSGVDDESIPTETDEVEAAALEAVRGYDLTSNDRVVRGRLATLEMIHERFTRHLRVSIFNLLANNPDVSLQSTQFIKYDEYVRSLFVPTSVNMFRLRPLKGVAYAVFDAKLVFNLVDNFYGGHGRHTKIEGREFTRAENRVIRRVLESLFRNLAEAWLNVLELKPQYVGSEVNPSLAGAIGSSEVVVVSKFFVDLPGGGGELHLAYPYSMLEPVRKYLEAPAQSSEADTDVDFGSVLRKAILNTNVVMGSALCRVPMTLRDVMAFREGQIIPIDIPPDVVVRANELPVFRARLGTSKGRIALRLEAAAQSDPRSDSSKLERLEAHAVRRDTERLEAIASSQDRSRTGE